MEKVDSNAGLQKNSTDFSLLPYTFSLKKGKYRYGNKKAADTKFVIDFLGRSSPTKGNPGTVNKSKYIAEAKKKKSKAGVTFFPFQTADKISYNIVENVSGNIVQMKMI